MSYKLFKLNVDFKRVDIFRVGPYIYTCIVSTRWFILAKAQGR